jgi:hypothetical protein
MMKLFAAAAFAAVMVGCNSPILAQQHDPNPQNDPDVRRGYNDTKERILQNRNGAENFRVHPSGESGALGTPPSEIRRDYEKEDRAKARK